MRSIFYRFIYFAYYLKHENLSKYRRFLKFARKESGKSGIFLLTDSVISTFRYNTSLLDYFYYRFYSLTREEREKWAGSGYMYEYQLVMNPKPVRGILENKIEFISKYNQFVKHLSFSYDQLQKDSSKIEQLLRNPSGKIVLKLSTGQVGKEVKIFRADEFSKENLLPFMKKNGFNLAEEFVKQHESLMALSPSGLNTVRVFSQLNGGDVEFLGARLRVSVNSAVDNMGAGNIAAPLDIETGVVNGAGIYSDITKKEETIHPVTGKPILGFQVPYWDEILGMIKQAALLHPENKSIGWDVAVTDRGPELIEGNHNWCRLLWQLPVKQGLKPMLAAYLKN